MNGYLGKFPKENTRTPVEWAMELIQRYGQIGGDHHKAWVLDRVARVLKGAPVTVTEARWSNGETEERFTVGTCEAYEQWVIEMKSGGGEEDYDEGVAP